MNKQKPVLHRLVLVGILVCAAALMLSACGGDDEPEDEQPAATVAPARDVPSPTAVPREERVAPTPSPVAARVSLDEYTDACRGWSFDGAEAEEADFTYRDISDLFGEGIRRLEAVEPPAAVAAWHHAVLAYQRAVKQATDDYSAPMDAVASDEFLLNVLFPTGLQYQPAIDAALRDMAPDARDKLIAADCIEGEYAEAPSVPKLTLGETTEAAVDSPGQPVRFTFAAQQGERFLIEVVKGTLPDFALNVPWSDSYRVIDLVYAEGRATITRAWQAPVSDTFYVQVWGSPDDSTGTFTITVRIDPRPDTPANARYAWEGTAIRVSWDAVAGADYYKVYYDDFAPVGCTLDENGNPKYCDELASRVDGTSFVHMPREPEKNFYWVVACNQEGCSEFEYDAAQPTEAPPATPANVQYAVEGSGIRLNWDAVDGADYYRVLHHNSAGCELRFVGRTCEELASNVTETTFLHANPNARYTNLYYWVAACNQGGCSKIDGRNPPVSIEGRTTAPARAPTATPGARTAAAPTPTPAPAPTAPAATAQSPTPVPVSTASTDRDALVALYNALDGANWQRDRNWLSDEPLSSWYGVDSDRDGRVTELNLGGIELSGEIPAEIGNLAELRVLDLSNNRLSGQIPAAIGNLLNLEELNLRGNKWRAANGEGLSGKIPPELGKLTNLKELDLSRHLLTGEIPRELGNLAQLERLHLDKNHLSGALPAELGGLTQLIHLWLGENDIAGAIPQEIGSLSRLLILDISQNQLTGEVPAEVGRLSRLRRLHLYNNQLNGSIPAELGSLPILTQLELQANQLSGPIPAELGNLSDLEILALNSNQLSGNIPASLGNLDKLLVLFLHENELDGEIPAELGNLSELRVLALHDNRLTGGAVEDLVANLDNLMAITVCELNDFPCDISGAVGEGVAASVEAVFGANGVIGSALGSVGGVLGNIAKTLGSFFGF